MEVGSGDGGGLMRRNKRRGVLGWFVEMLMIPIGNAREWLALIVGMIYGCTHLYGTVQGVGFMLVGRIDGKIFQQPHRVSLCILVSSIPHIDFVPLRPKRHCQLPCSTNKAQKYGAGRFFLISKTA